MGSNYRNYFLVAFFNTDGDKSANIVCVLNENIPLCILSLLSMFLFVVFIFSVYSLNHFSYYSFVMWRDGSGPKLLVKYILIFTKDVCQYIFPQHFIVLLNRFKTKIDGEILGKCSFAVRTFPHASCLR